MNVCIPQVYESGCLVFLLVPFAVESSAARMMPATKSVLSKYLQMTLSLYIVEERKALPWGRLETG